jgi:MFS family permease
MARKTFRATNVYFIATFATLGGMLFGFDISSISGVIGTPQYIAYFNNPSSGQQGGITASMPGGSFVGALASGILSDKISRKYTIQLGAIIWCIGAILQCAAQNIGMVISVRNFSKDSLLSVDSLLVSLLDLPALWFQFINQKSLPRTFVDGLCPSSNGRSHGES